MSCENTSIELIENIKSGNFKKIILKTQKKREKLKLKNVCRGEITQGYIEESLRDSKCALVYYSKKKRICGLLMFSYYDADTKIYIKLLCTRSSNGNVKGRTILEKLEEIAKERNINTIATHALSSAYPFWKSMKFLRLNNACEWEDTGRAERVLYPSCNMMCGEEPCRYIDSGGCATTDINGEYCKLQNPHAHILCRDNSAEKMLNDDEDPLLYGFWLSKCISQNN